MTTQSGEHISASKEAGGAKPAGEVQLAINQPVESEQIVQSANAGINSRNPRSALETIRTMIQESREKKQSNASLEKKLEELKKSKKPEDQALAIDFQIAIRQNELTQIDEAIAIYQKELLKPDITPENKSKCESEVGRLQVSRNGKTNENGEIIQKGTTHNLDDLKAERQKLPANIPNAVQELASIFGISSEDANPVGGIINILEAVKADHKQEKLLKAELKKNGMPNNGLSVVSDTLRIMRGEKKLIEKAGKVGLTIAEVMAVLSGLFVWLANKREQAGAGGAG